MYHRSAAGKTGAAMKHAGRVLIVDDEPDVVANWSRVLERDGYHCLGVTDSQHALRLLETERPDVVLTDLQMPDADGLAILRRAVELDPDVAVVVITGHGTVQSAVEAMQTGAFDYLLKPLPSNDVLRLAVQRGLARRQLLDENRRLREGLSPQVGLDKVIGKSPAIEAVFELVRKAARAEASILVQGESGTGKELIARAIHANSARAAGVFVPVDCAALPENLLESELFGHERGAFTGADRVKPGMFEVADGGTLFLDEVGELPLGLQAKLLRALQEREIRRVGGTKQIPVDVRLVAATNRDLAESVRKREFREDLFYRLNVIPIVLPPLRDRPGDVPLLAYHFLGRYGRNRERPLEGIEPEALAALEAYPWPGNIRELQNAIERACVLADGPALRLRDLGEHVRARGRVAPAAASGAILPFREARDAWLRSFTSEYLTDLIRQHGGNVSQAARTAGVDRKTLHRLLTKFGIRA
jgi:DNA-binding NtrC family response regulator